MNLKQFLQKDKLSPIYLLLSEQELLIQEARDEIFSFLKSLDYLEKNIYLQSTNFNWKSLIAELSTQSFFNEKRIFDLRFPDAKLGREGSNFILKTAELANLENILIISLPLIWQVKKNKWFINIAKKANIFEFKVPEFSQLPRWIKDRLAKYNLTIEEDALNFFTKYVDGNLLVANQEINKLKILFADRSNYQIKLSDLKNILIDASKFEIDDLKNNYLTGNWRKALHIVDRLEADGVSPLAVSWHLNNDLNKAMKVYGYVNNGMSEKEALQKQNLFYDKAINFKSFYKKCSNPKFFRHLMRNELLDLACKNVGLENPWQNIRKRIIDMQ